MKTITEENINKIEVDKSKFVAICFPIADEEIFKEKLLEIKKEHSKARHVVYAYRIGQKSKSCDDNEPKGTAGRPLLELLHKKDLNNLAIIVVRYFGGTKLGASRLLRTYIQAGNEVLNKTKQIDL